MWMLLVASVASAAPTGCTEGADTTDLTTAISDAEATFSNLDIAAFKEATDRLRAILPCLEDPLTRHLSAEVHRFLGIRAFGDRDPDAELYFAAARAIEPDYQFPSSLIPEGNPVRTAYVAYDVGNAREDTVAEPATGSLQFDARTSLDRPAAWPTIYQRMDESGAVAETAYLLPTEAVPEYPVKLVRIVPVDTDDPTDPVRPPAPPLRKPLLIGTIAAAAATGALYGLAGVAHGTYMDPGTPDAELGGLRSRANALTVTSAVTGAATVALGVGLVTTF